MPNPPEAQLPGTPRKAPSASSKRNALLLFLSVLLVSVWHRVISGTDAMLEERIQGAFFLEASQPGQERVKAFLPEPFLEFWDRRCVLLALVWGLGLLLQRRMRNASPSIRSAATLLWTGAGIGAFALLLRHAEGHYLDSLRTTELHGVLVEEIVRRDFTPRKGFCTRQLEYHLLGFPDARNILRVNCALSFAAPFRDLRKGDRLWIRFGTDPNGHLILLGLRQAPDLQSP